MAHGVHPIITDPLLNQLITIKSLHVMEHHCQQRIVIHHRSV